MEDGAKSVTNLAVAMAEMVNDGKLFLSNRTVFLSLGVESVQHFAIIKICTHFALLQILDTNTDLLTDTSLESQKTFTFPTDRMVFAFFGEGSSVEVHCFDYLLVFGMYLWVHDARS